MASDVYELVALFEDGIDVKERILLTGLTFKESRKSELIALEKVLSEQMVTLAEFSPLDMVGLPTMCLALRKVRNERKATKRVEEGSDLSAQDKEVRE